MIKQLFTMGLAVCILALAGCAGSEEKAAKQVNKTAVPLMSAEQLLERLDDPSVTILDVRVHIAYVLSKSKIKNAVFENPRQLDRWIDKYDRGGTYVLYCG